ncbi:MAG: methyltransferase [Christensenellaceae bacterium]|nr:methyltransferase [Christensenellaceae bacterium]
MNYDFLEGGVKIIQAEGGYHFSSDAIALAKFFVCKKSATVIDIGCGSGVLTLFIKNAFNPKKIVAVDINPRAAELCAENVKLNEFENIEVKTADARELYREMPNLADAIICNPPYFNNGKKSANETKLSARHDDTLTLTDLAVAATRLLKCGGEVFFCVPSARTAEAVQIFQNNNLAIKQIKFISNPKGVYLALLKAKYCGKNAVEIII